MVQVTVGVPCYNVEGYVEHCIRSILDQSFADFEIVAIDDGSTDSTGAVLDSLAAGDQRLRVLRQENMGLGPTKNQIVREARGIFLVFVDADDWIAPDCLEESHHRAVADDLDIVAFGWARIEDGTGRVLDERRDHRGLDTNDRDGMRQTAFSGKLNSASWGSLVRRQLFLDNALLYPDCLHEDTYVTPFLYFYGRRYGYVNRRLCYWRAREGSITARVSESHIDGLAGAFSAWKERLSREGVYDEFRQSALKGLITYLSLVRLRIENMENGDPKLLHHLKSRALSFPELLDLKKYIPWEERREHIEVGRILEHQMRPNAAVLQATPEANHSSEADRLPKPWEAKTVPPRTETTMNWRTGEAAAKVRGTARRQDARNARFWTLGSRLVRACRHQPIRSLAMKRLASPTSAFLLGGLALTGAAIFDVVWSAWLAAPGLALIGLVVMKESILWRWRRERDLKVLMEAIGSERSRVERVLADERGRAEKALADERGRAEKALAAALADERGRAEKALADERGRAEKALAAALADERGRAEKALAAAVADERNGRSLVDVHLANRELPLKRVLLLFTIPRSGSTWLFDILRTHPAVRVEPTARVWTALDMHGLRYPAAFHHVDGASVPLEIAPSRAAAIPAFPQATLPDVHLIDEIDRWALEKAHPSFVEFDARRLTSRIQDLRRDGTEVEVVYGLRNPLASMWSMVEYKARDPEWLKTLQVDEVPRFVARSLATLSDLHALVGGVVVEYENLPDGTVMGSLCQRLVSEWGEAEARAWISHAASATDRYKRRWLPESSFLGERNRSRDPAGPDGAWATADADIEAAKAAHRRLVAESEEKPASVPQEKAP